MNPVVRKDGAHANGLAQLKKSGLRGKSGSRAFRIEGAYGRAGIAIGRANVHQTAVCFADERDVPTIREGFNKICPKNDFTHAEIAATRSRSEGTQSEK